MSVVVEQSLTYTQLILNSCRTKHADLSASRVFINRCIFILNRRLRAHYQTGWKNVIMKAGKKLINYLGKVIPHRWSPQQVRTFRIDWNYSSGIRIISDGMHLDSTTLFTAIRNVTSQTYRRCSPIFVQQQSYVFPGEW